MSRVMHVDNRSNDPCAHQHHEESDQNDIPEVARFVVSIIRPISIGLFITIFLTTILSLPNTTPNQIVNISLGTLIGIILWLFENTTRFEKRHY